jgi:hypothetical protein
MLALLRGEPVSGVMSRVSPLVSTSNEVDENDADTLAEATFLLHGDDDDDGVGVDAEEDPASETISVPIKLSAVPQVHMHAYYYHMPCLNLFTDPNAGNYFYQ